MHLRFYGWMGFIAVTSVWGVLLSACAKQQPYAASTNLVLTPEEHRTKQVLTPAEEKQAMAILSSVADGAKPVDPPGTAINGVRWRDVPRAASAACSETEMVVVQSIKHDWGIEFLLRTVEDYPGMLNVRRTNDDRVYEADATIGLFQDQTKRAADLLRAFDKSMAAYGRKLEFEHDPFESREDGR